MQKIICETSFHHFAQFPLFFLGNFAQMYPPVVFLLPILCLCCQFVQFLLEHLSRCSPSKHFPWIVINPVLYYLYFLYALIIKVYPFWYFPAYQSVLVLIAPSFIAAIRMAVVYLCSVAVHED